MNYFFASQSLPMEDWTSSATSQSICMKNNTMKRGLLTSNERKYPEEYEFQIFTLEQSRISTAFILKARQIKITLGTPDKDPELSQSNFATFTLLYKNASWISSKLMIVKHHWGIIF